MLGVDMSLQQELVCSTPRFAVEVSGNHHGDVGASVNLLQTLQERADLEPDPQKVTTQWVTVSLMLSVQVNTCITTLYACFLFLP
jgi:hypothetical protein